MREAHRIGVVIPALNEEGAIGNVIRDIPAWVDIIVVADNGSTDRTAEVARGAGATVVTEPERGYGAACLAGIRTAGLVDIVVFVDGDYSDHPEDMADLVTPIVEGRAELVIGVQHAHREHFSGVTDAHRRAPLPRGGWRRARAQRFGGVLPAPRPGARRERAR